MRGIAALRKSNRHLLAIVVAVLAVSAYVITWRTDGRAVLVCHGVLPILIGVIYFRLAVGAGISLLLVFAVQIARELTQWGIFASEGGKYWGPASGSMGDVEAHIWAAIWIAGLGMLLFLATTAVCCFFRFLLNEVFRPHYPKGSCQACGYDARGNAGMICPECGKHAASDGASGGG